MTEEQATHDESGPETASAEPSEPAEPVRTGVERVDAVVDAVSGLDDRPVDEHVAVFESAHDELRRTLDVSAGRRRVGPLGPCRRAACGSTPSWSAADSPGRASTPAS